MRSTGARHCFEKALGVRPGDAAARSQLATLDLELHRLKRKEDGDKERAIVREFSAEKQAGTPGAKRK